MNIDMMDFANRLTEELTSTLVPRAALIAYQSDSEGNNSYYLEMRRILANGTMGEGKPVPWSFLDDIARNYVDSTGGMPHGVLPDNLWYSDPRRGAEKYVWSNPPCKRRMFFRESLGIPDGEYHVPGVVYIAGESTLHAYAYKGEKLKSDSALYFGPFFNTTEGSVCLGTATVKKPMNPTYAELMEYWEKRFWLTEFTHLGGGGNPTKNNLVVVTKASADNPFDENELLSAGKKLKDIL